VKVDMTTINYYAIVIDNKEGCNDFVKSDAFKFYYKYRVGCFGSDEELSNSQSSTCSNVNSNCNSNCNSVNSQNTETTKAIKINLKMARTEKMLTCQLGQETSCRINDGWKLILFLVDDKSSTNLKQFKEIQLPDNPDYCQRDFFKEKTLIASCILEDNPDLEEEQNTIEPKIHPYKIKYEIHEVCVNPEFQGKGLCALLMQKAVSVIKDNTINGLFTVYCVNNNAASCCCYRKIGLYDDIDTVHELHYKKTVDKKEVGITRFIYTLKNDGSPSKKVKVIGGTQMKKSYKMSVNPRTKIATFVNGHKNKYEYDFSNTTLFKIYKKFVMDHFPSKIRLGKTVPPFPPSFDKYNEKRGIVLIWL
jgi:Acetyltransferase (GNAT) family